MTRYCEPCDYAGKSTEATTSYMSPIAGLTLCCEPCKKANAPIAAALELKPDYVPVSIPSQSKSPTSRAGAAKASLKAGSQAYKCLEAIANAPDGLINEQVQNVTGYPVNVVCGRLNSLGRGKFDKETGEWMGLKFITVSGERVSSSGVECQVYQITEAGRAYLAASKLGRAA